MKDKLIKIRRTIYPQFSQFFRGYVDKKIFFIHLPKCGGSSIHQGIKNSFNPFEWISGNLIHLDPQASLKGSQIAGSQLSDYREKLLLYFMSKDQCKYISGHFIYSDNAFQEFGNEWNFITVIREPVSRWFSHYFFNRFKTDNHFHLDLDLESFVESEQGIAWGSTYVNKFAGNILPGEVSSNEAINQAINNLNNLTLVGVLERLDIFARDYEKLFGARIVFDRYKTNPLSKDKQQEQITESIRKKVENICQPDIIFYESALKRIRAKQQ
ncbi:MAG: sulfotransferase family 2 domain-containing protein [Symploca sp. SIO2B6]|nr:sulfotransferase family 2 domain-containing protein [Symploca sp. SIO2B6]